MKIYVDGCDGSGKSTLADYLVKRFNIDKFCLTKDSEKSMSRYEDIARMNNVVCDRTFLSEAVYPKVFGREEWLSKGNIKFLLSYYSTAFDNIFVICTAPNKVLEKRLLERGNEYKEVIDNIPMINKKYRNLAEQHCLLLVDTSEDSFEKIANKIERRIFDGRYLCR